MYESVPIMNPEYRLLTKRNILLFFSLFNLSGGYMVGNRLMVCLGFALLFLQGISLGIHSLLQIAGIEKDEEGRK